MRQLTILGAGHLGRAVAAAAAERGVLTALLGRPSDRRHDPAAFEGADVVVDATHASSVGANIEVALNAGVRRFVIATTGWDGDRATVDASLRGAAASAVASSNFSLGVALFGRLVEVAADLFGAVDGFDPYLVEWHRRGKADRPSGTAIDLRRRLVGRHPAIASAGDLEVASVRAGTSPGMHLVGFDAVGETLELRLTARDRSPYVAGILAAADWLDGASRPPGVNPFDPVVDALLARSAVAA